jgi:hypothetical protein
MSRKRAEIVEALTQHLHSTDGTLNDSTTDSLFREWYRLGPEVETELEAVEKWALATVGTKPLTGPRNESTVA